MKQKLLTALLSLISLILVGLGLGAVVSPVIPYGPSPLPVAIILPIGLLLLAAGVYLWTRAWRRSL